MGQVFPQVFNANMMGRSFKEFASEMVYTTHHDLTRRWFHSDYDGELFVWADANRRIIKQQFFCFGQVVEWNAVEGVRTGGVRYDENNASAGETLHFDENILFPSLIQACEVIRHIEALASAERDTLCANFQSGELRRSMPPRWMQGLKRPDSSSTVWKRLLTKFKAWFNR